MKDANIKIIENAEKPIKYYRVGMTEKELKEYEEWKKTKSSRKT